MIQYAIVAFPKTEALDAIESVRRRFDPQTHLIGAHVTLVFPFRSRISETELRSHMEGAAAIVPAFELTFGGVRTENEEYVFLEFHSGLESLLELHGRLYRGPLSAHLSPNRVYRPHITVARVADRAGLAMAEQLADAIPAVSATVTELAAFRLEHDGRGSVAFIVPLSGNR